MNRSNIEWCEMTSNPITGCMHGCPYCYARTFAKRLQAMGVKQYENGFEPAFHPEELKTWFKRKKPTHIFVCSMSGMFGLWVPLPWIQQILQAMARSPQHSYTVLTKNPARVADLMLHPREYLRLGTSITGRIDPVETNRLSKLRELGEQGHNTVLSLEPYLNPISPVNFPKNISWLIVGGLTGAKRQQPPPEWIDPLVDWAHERGIPLFIKANAGYPAVQREYPAGVPHR